MYRTNLTGTGWMEIVGAPFRESLSVEVKCRVIGEVKIFNARGVLQRVVKGKELKDHIDSKLVESAYLGDCHSGSRYTDNLDSRGEENVKKFKRRLKRTITKMGICECGRKFVGFSKSQVRCGLCKIKKAMNGYRI